ncbi:hypothetical protein MTO96_019212 [Rhipicephalus appendiculatus]
MIRRLRAKFHYWLNAEDYTPLLEKTLDDLRSDDTDVAIRAADFVLGLFPLLQAPSLRVHYNDIVCSAYKQLVCTNGLVRSKMSELLEMMIALDMQATTELMLFLADEADSMQLAGILTALCKVLRSDMCMKDFPNQQVLSFFEKYLDSRDDNIRSKAIAGALLMDYYFKAASPKPETEDDEQ